MLLQVADVRPIRGQAVLDHDHRQLRMVLAKLGQKAAGGVPLTVVLGGAVLLDDRFGGQGDHGREVRVQEHAPQHLVRIGRRAVGVGLFQA